MNLLHDAYTALLSGITYRTGSEIHWHNKYGHLITVEPVDVERESYIVRYYYENGSLDLEENYSQRQLHGKYTSWYKNGQKCWEEDYVNGQLHGKCIEWYESGQKEWETNYVNDQKHGKSAVWSKDGTLIHETYYIHGRIATREEWKRYNESTT